MQFGDANLCKFGVLKSNMASQNTFTIISTLFFPRDFESKCLFGTQIEILKMHQFIANQIQVIIYNPPVVESFFVDLWTCGFTI